jgi:hypothetical protein
VVDTVVDDGDPVANDGRVRRSRPPPLGWCDHGIGAAAVAAKPCRWKRRPSRERIGEQNGRRAMNRDHERNARGGTATDVA